MKQIFKVLLLVFIVSSCAKDEPDDKNVTPKVCDTDRYEKPQFNDIEMTTVKYGSNINTSGVRQDLFMDVYQPVGDTLSKRPVVILAFGGSFITGDRKQLAELAKEITKLGYVSACIDYRLLSFAQWPIDSIKGFDIAIKAAGDMKAAIRYFRKDAATTNTFKINPDKIIIGGISAGAIAAIQAAYFDGNDNIEAHVKSAIEKNGGVEGNSGDAENLKYSSAVQGVINLSGAIYRPYFIDQGEAPLVSFHGNKDEVVPYGYDFVKPAGIPILPLYGSSEMHIQTQKVGIKSSLTTVNEGGHENIYTEARFADIYNTFRQNAYLFNKEIICQ